MTFKDHFSGHADDYAAYRPTYPPGLFAYLAGLAPARELAWDAGCGSGQAALGLAAHFARVVATDPSAEQIRHAVAHERILYKVEPAERSSLAPSSADLIVVAQALHWFDLDRFYGEARRVLKPGGALAAWCYGLTRVSPEIDPIVDDFYRNVVGPYWPPERRYIDERYASLPFPFTELDAPAFEMSARWSLDEFVGYLGTWSAVKRYRRERGEEALTLIRDRLARVWSPAQEKRAVRWPIHMRLGRQ
jgi:SAM-dependent methyltransferase